MDTASGWIDKEFLENAYAVVHLAGRPLELLPDKYCSNPADLRRALRQLLTRPFARALFAHGEPMASLASDRIATLLSSAG